MKIWLKMLAGLTIGLAVLVLFSNAIGAQDYPNAPDFSLKDLEGEKLSLADFEGKVLFINFWATWCPPCRQEIPGFIEVYEKYKADGMAIIGVSLDRKGAKVVVDFAEKLKITYPLAMADEDIVQDYRPGQYIPSTIVIDREGRIRDKHVGFLDKDALEKLFLEFSK